MKSQPVPRAITASSIPSRAAIPFATSLTVPSPPTATSRRAPRSAARRASSTSCPGRSEMSASPLSPSVAARRASSGQRLPVAPLSEAGLTKKTVSSLMVPGGDGGEGDARHAVDCGLELLVGDAAEFGADHDVADGEEGAGLDAPKRADREQNRGLHLDAEYAA